MFSFLIIIFVKNHNLFLALDNQTVKLLSIWSINWISSVYSHEHVGCSNTSFYSAIMSMLAILQCQLSLSSQACQLALSCSIFLTQFSLTQIFSLIFLLLLCLTDLILIFEILIRFTVTNDYSVLYCVFVERFFICSVFHHVLSSCLRFQSSLLLQIVFNLVQYFQKKSFVCTFKFQKYKFL